jgi:hypothetical protein
MLELICSMSCSMIWIITSFRSGQPPPILIVVVNTSESSLARHWRDDKSAEMKCKRYSNSDDLFLFVFALNCTRNAFDTPDKTHVTIGRMGSFARSFVSLLLLWHSNLTWIPWYEHQEQSLFCSWSSHASRNLVDVEVINRLKVTVCCLGQVVAGLQYPNSWRLSQQWQAISKTMSWRRMTRFRALV